jgi:beta-galactosidase GanA
MRLNSQTLSAVCILMFWIGSAIAEPLPRLQTNGSAIQLMVDDEPWIALAGEVHNSSASSETYMRPIWDHLVDLNLNTIVTPAYWELVEPEEDVFDFDLVDFQIAAARKRNMRIVLLWFGAVKNAKSMYAPVWVRADMKRFPRAQIRQSDIQYTNKEAPLSMFSDNVAAADAKALARLMAHLATTDAERTVIAVQVENEAGLLGDSRDRSPLAETAWNQPVPQELVEYLVDNRARLMPSVASLWERGGYSQSGTWAEVFGDDWQAEELFMAWGVSRYVNRVAEAGKASLSLPMYANAWLGPQKQDDEAGTYPSGGPVPRVFDVWRAGAPAIDWLSPDIYVDEFEGWASAYARADNPLFIPEAKFKVGNLFVALGEFRAIGFSPFGIEDGLPNNQIAQAYKLLSGALKLIAEAQANGSIAGFALDAGATRTIEMGDYVIKIQGGRDALRKMFLDMGIPIPVVAPDPVPQNRGNSSPEVTDQRPTGLILQLDRDEFLILGQDLSIDFQMRRQTGAAVELARVEEGHYVDGEWIPGRVLNGDERLGILPFDELGMARIRLLRTND